MDGSAFRVIQISDVSGVGQSLAAAVGRDAVVVHLPIRQFGAQWNPALKPLALPFRYREARRVLSVVDGLLPRPDVMHIHWLPNGVVGALQRRSGRRIPWVLHVHGDDVRALAGWRQPGYIRLLQQADAVVFSTPDLAEYVWQWRPDAEHLPTPVGPLSVVSERATWDVFAASAALPIKGASVAFDALRLIAERRPSARLAAMGGHAFQLGTWDRLDWAPHDEFLGRLSSSTVIIGQMKLGIVSNVELEAMALGRAVVGWTHGHLYNETPPIALATEPNDISRTVIELLDDLPRRVQLGRLGMEWVRTYHTPAAVARRLLAIYERITGITPS